MNTTLLKQYTTTVSAGYMGAVKLTGSKSHKFLYGGDLSKEVKQALQNVLEGDLKKSQILAKIKTYSGGQHLTITLKLDKSVYGATLEEYKNIIKEKVQNDRILWIWKEENGNYTQVFHEAYWKEKEEGRKQIENATADKMAEFNYNNADFNINHYYINDEPLLNAEGKKLVNAANQVIKAFNSDDSNAMVDYFDVNFYYDINIKWF